MKSYIYTLGGMVAVMAGSMTAKADTLVDRGLPTANLNNAAGGNRSNVAWADTEATNTPSEYYLPGDDFTIGGAGSYHISTIRVWTVGDQTGLSLLGGLDGGPMNAISSGFTATPVTYGNGDTYQRSSGAFENLYQIDFSVNLTLAAGQKFDFFVDGPWSAAAGGFVNTYLHSSNAALSGSPQDGSDDTFKWLHVNGGQTVETWFSGTGGGTSGFAAGWDKNSDANVQVLGSVVPLPSSALAGLVLLGGLGLAGAIKRTKRIEA